MTKDQYDSCYEHTNKDCNKCMCDDCPHKGTLICEVDMPCVDWEGEQKNVQ